MRNNIHALGGRRVLSGSIAVVVVVSCTEEEGVGIGDMRRANVVWIGVKVVVRVEEKVGVLLDPNVM